MVVGTEDICHFKRQPTAVVIVGQEIDLVASAAERGYVRAYFLVTGVGRTFYHLREWAEAVTIVEMSAAEA